MKIDRILSEELLMDIKSRLQDTYGKRLKGIVLYGSEARGNSKSESDIDLLVLLKGPIHLWQDISTITDTLYSLQLELDRPLSALPADVDAYDAQDRPLYRNAMNEGIRV